MVGCLKSICMFVDIDKQLPTTRRLDPGNKCLAFDVAIAGD
jgi:hypothetical protein